MHSHVLGFPEYFDGAPAVNLQKTYEQIFEYVSEFVPARNRIDFNRIHNPLNEVQFVQNISVVNVFGAATQERLIESDEKVKKYATKVPSLGEQLHAIGFLRRVAYFYNTIGDHFVSILRWLHADNRRKRRQSALQTTIDSFLT